MSDDLERRRAEDAHGRRISQREFERPVVIEAGAGTGKTATLVARVLAWCLGPGWERALAADPAADPARTAERVLRGVVAITFTEAAAAVMDTRIEAALAELDRGERPVGFEDFDGGVASDRVTALRGALDQLVVQTIHAFCRRLLARFPIEAGLHPRFEVDADGSALAAAAREAVSAQLTSAYARGDESALALAESGVGPHELEQALVGLLQNGATAAELAADPLATGRIEALWTRLADAHERFAAAAGDRLDAVTRGDKAGATAAALAAGRTRLAAPTRDAASLGQLQRELGAAWSQKTRNALRDWANGKHSRAEADAFGEGAAGIGRAAGPLNALLAHLERIDPDALARVGPVLASLAAAVEERLWRRGRVGFEGLLARTAALLEQHPEIAAKLRSDIDQLLVDEFQDTDARQCSIVAALALEGVPGTRPGLFLVGDPKQSIYGWRNADLAAYESLLGRIREAGGSVEKLCVNHRSVPAVLDEVERVIAPVMQREAGVQPAYEGLAPSPKLESEAGFAAGGRAPVEYWIPAMAEQGVLRVTRASDAAAAEATELARDLRELHDDHGVSWGAIGVLFRSRGDWDVYLGALRRAGVPYSVEGDRSYYRRREIVDAAALVCCVLDSNDQLALVASLRSSAAGVPDAAWLPLWAGGFPALAARLGTDAEALAALRELLERVAAEIGGEAPEAGLPAWHVSALAHLESVAALRRAFDSDPGDRFVERLRAALCFEAVEASRFAGSWRVANLAFFFSDLAEAFAAGEPVASVLRRIRRAVAEEEPLAAEPAAPGSQDAVSVLTLHGAKGLHWEHVYLMQLHKGSGGGREATQLGRHDGRLEGVWCDWPTLAHDAVRAHREQVAAAEQVRTLYVGMTRARKRLVLCGLWPTLQERSGGSCHAELLVRREPPPPDLEALARAAAERGGRAGAADALWVFPALLPAASSTGVAAAPRGRVASSTPVAASPPPEWARRMALPTGISVSALAHPDTDALDDDAGAQRSVDGAASRPTGAGMPASAAARVGTAIHAALERLDLEAPDADAEWARQREGIAAEIERTVPPAALTRARADALECWDALGRGPLAARLRGIGEGLVARELPLLLHPESLPDRVSGPPATGFVSGAIDLLYRDADGRLVIVDFKTDRQDGESEAPEHYVRQGALYCHAVAQALGAASPPRFEIWWLRSGRVEQVAPRP